MYAEKLSSPNAREAHEEGTWKRLYQSSLLAAVSALNEQRTQKSCQYNKLHSRESFNASCDQEAIQQWHCNQSAFALSAALEIIIIITIPAFDASFAGCSVGRREGRNPWMAAT